MPKTGWMKPGLEARGHPTIKNIAWAAGVYEGEGSCGVGEVRVSITQKDRWILDQFRFLFGGSVAYDKKSGIYKWLATGTRGRGFLMTIYSFLSPRRMEQVRHILLSQRKLQLSRKEKAA